SPPDASEGYKKGYRAGRVGGPAILIGIGLRLLLKRDGESGRVKTPRITASPSYASRTPAAPAPPPPTRIPVRILCSCGQEYTFEVEPVGGRMPGPVGCPSC